MIAKILNFIERFFYRDAISVARAQLAQTEFDRLKDMINTNRRDVVQLRVDDLEAGIAACLSILQFVKELDSKANAASTAELYDDLTQFISRRKKELIRELNSY